MSLRGRTIRSVPGLTAATLLAVFVAAGDVAAAAGAPVTVVVGLRFFAPPGEVPSSARARAEEVALAAFAAGVERPGVRVAFRQLLSGSIPGADPVLGDVAAQDPDAALREEALCRGAAYRVVASVTRLAGRGIVDVQLLPALEGPAIRRLDGEDELARLEGALGRLGAQVGGVAAELGAPVLAQAESEIDAAYATEAATPAIPAAGSIVVELRIEGNRRIEGDAIRAVIGTREGQRLRRAQVAADIRRIHELGFFSDVQVFSTDVVAGRIVTFVVTESPIIRQVTLTGNDEIDSDDIKEHLTITVGSTIDYPLLIENRERIRILYQSKGFYLAEVEYEVESMAEDAVRVDFNVVEGEKLRLREIDFRGNESLSDGELLDGLQTRPWGLFSLVTHFWDHSGLYAEPIFYQDLDLITRKYMDQGFIRVQVSDPEVSYDDEGIRVAVSIQEGPQFSVGRVDVIGDESTDTDELLEMVALEEGDLFNRSILADDVERLRAHYSDRGFFDARVRPRTNVDPDARTVDSLFEVEKGGLYFVDWIRVSGNRRTRDRVVRREVGLAEGDMYSDRALERSRARVKRLGYFEEVSVETEQTQPNRLGVVIDVVERPTGTFSFGAGFGSTDGFLVNASISQDNLFGRGYALAASIDLGRNNRFGSLRFTDPYFRGTPAAVSGSLQLSEVEFLDFNQSVFGLSLDLSYPLDEGETRAGLGYSYSDREVDGFQEFTQSSLLTREEFQGSTDTSMITFSGRRDTRDDIRFPRNGSVYGVALELAGLGGLNEFVRFEARATKYLPLRRWLGFESTFVVNSRIGWAVPFNTISDFGLPGCDATGLVCQGALLSDADQLAPLTQIDEDLELPLSERYFLGGIGAFQVRGFKQRSLGPRRTFLQRQAVPGGWVFRPYQRSSAASGPRCVSEVDLITPLPDDACNDLQDTDASDFENLELADIIGGNKMFLLNLELQIPISEDMGLTGLVFFDMGNAFAEDQSFNPADLRLGTGFGVQWFSPFGPILLELGFPLDPLDDEDGSVFEFSLGGAPF